MARYSTTILEEELKNKVAADRFSNYDTTQIVGRIDFSVAVKSVKAPRCSANMAVETSLTCRSI